MMLQIHADISIPMNGLKSTGSAMCRKQGVASVSRYY